MIENVRMAGEAQSGSKKRPVRTVLLAVSLALGVLILIVGGALLWLDTYIKTHAPERIVRPQGALLATDVEGLRRLNELYALPKTCTESNMRKAQVPEGLTLCAVANPPAGIGTDLVSSTCCPAQKLWRRTESLCYRVGA